MFEVLGELVKTFGLPAGLLIYFVAMDYLRTKEHKEDLRNIAVTSVKAIDAGTEATKDATTRSVKNTAALEANSRILNRVEGVLTARGIGNGNGN